MGGDTITAVNNCRVNMKPDSDVLQLVKTSVAVLELTVRRTARDLAASKIAADVEESGSQAPVQNGESSVDASAIDNVPEKPNLSTLVLVHAVGSGQLQEVQLDDLVGKMPEPANASTMTPAVPPAPSAATGDACATETIVSPCEAEPNND